MDIPGIIQRFGYSRLQTLLDVPYGTVSSWKARGYIPSRFWTKIVEEAKRLEIEGVTLETLAAADASRTRGDVVEAAA